MSDNPYNFSFGDFGFPTSNTVYKNPADGVEYSFTKSVFCEHDWHPWGTGYDDNVKCSKCGKVKEHSPGDYAPW